MDFDRRTVGLFAQQGRSHEVRLANSFAFGGARRHGLSSDLRFLNLTGTLRQNALDLTELLRLELPWGLAGQASYALRGILGRPGGIGGQPRPGSRPAISCTKA